jgi:hypothetical protein
MLLGSPSHVSLQDVERSGDSDVEASENHQGSPGPALLSKTLTFDGLSLAYKDGERVEYYSQTVRRWLPANVWLTTHNGQSASSAQDVRYGLMVGRARQRRQNVPLYAIRLPLRENEPVDFFNVEQQLDTWTASWMHARMWGSQPCGATTVGYKVQLNNILKNAVRADFVRRRFPVGSTVEVYRVPLPESEAHGRPSGWVPAIVAPYDSPLEQELPLAPVGPRLPLDYPCGAKSRIPVYYCGSESVIEADSGRQNTEMVAVYLLRHRLE